MRDFFFTPLDGWDAYQKLREAVRESRLVTAFGMADGQKAHLAAALCRDTERPVLLVCANDAQAARCFDDMTQFLGQGVYLLPGREVALYHVSAASRELTFRRAETLWAAASGRARAVVTSVAALQHRLMPVESFRPFALSLSVGQRADMAQVAAALAGAGYERVERVDARGQFALRGGILDVFPPTGTDALRVEWFDDEVDSIRTLEVSTQRSTGNLRACELPPAAELLRGTGRRRRGRRKACRGRWRMRCGGTGLRARRRTRERRMRRTRCPGWMRCLTWMHGPTWTRRAGRRGGRAGYAAEPGRAGRQGAAEPPAGHARGQAGIPRRGAA